MPRSPFRALLAGFPLMLVAACSEGGRDFFLDPARVVDQRLAEVPEAGFDADADAAAPARPATARRPAIRGFIRHGLEGTDLGRVGAGRRAPDDRPGDISLDFQDADLASVIQVMMEEGLDANYVLDPRVEGSVTLRTNRPLRRDEILPTLEEILRLNEAAIVNGTGIWRIVPIAEAGATAPLMTFDDVTSRGLTVRVTPLRFVGVDDVSGVLDSFAPVAGSIRYDRTRNLVFTVGTAAEQATLMDVIATLDVDFLAGRSFALRPLEGARPQAVVDELGVVFARPDGSANPAIRFVPIQRMNAVLIVSEERALLDQALELMGFLDQDAGEAPRLHVFAIRNRRATEVAQLLGRIFNAEVSLAGAGSGAAPGLGIRRDAATGGTTRLSQGGGTDGDAGAEAAIAAAAAATPVAAAGTSSGGGRGDFGSAGVFRVVADETSNAIVALATSPGADALAQALERIDVKPLQVMIEATLVEVALTDELEFGVRWFLQSGNFSFDFGDALGTGAASVLPGFNAAFQTNDIDVTLSALDEVSDVRLLSSPTLMVLDNQVARLQVGDQVPVTVRAATSTDDPDAPIVTETEFRDTGVILEIRPTVDASGAVLLEIRQEVSDVLDTDSLGNPTFAQRVIESTISVQSGETVALAGLIEEGSTLSRDGIPVVSRLPGLGALFGTTRDGVSRSELLVLIRPIVVRDQNEARQATEELRRRLIGMVPRPPEQGLRLSPERPVDLAPRPTP